MSKMLVTIAYGNYWEKYGERFESMCAALDEQPDRLVVITDKPIVTKYENVVFVPNSGLNNYSIGEYRQKALDLCDCDWLIQIDIDDIMYPNYISNLNDDVDWHIFLLKNNETQINQLKNSIDNFYNTDYLPYGNLLNSAIKTNALRQAGGYKTSYGWEDIILVCDLLKNNTKHFIDLTLRGERLLDNEGSITKAPTEIKQRKSDETKTYHNRLKTMNRKEQIQRLYKLILGREADEGGLNHYLNSRLDLYQIQMGLWDSDEFRNKFNHINPIETSDLNNDLPIFVINLERRPDRKHQITQKLNSLGIKNYQILNAVDGKKLSTDQIQNDYDDNKSKEIHRAMTASEIACALSHIECAKKILVEDLEYAVILEDDAQLTLQFKQFLKDFDLSENYGFDFLILGAFSSNQFFNGKVKTKTSPYKLIEKESIIYLDEIKYNIGSTSIHDSHYPTKRLDYVHGTHAYIMSKAGAKKLLEINYPVIVEADNMWNYFPDICTIQFTNPILCHRQHLDSDIHTGRIGLVSDDKNFSDGFLKRKDHTDFGT